MMQITLNARRQHECRADAERAIEIYYPPGYCYWICEHTTQAGRERYRTYAVRVSNDDGTFLGYAYDPDEATAAGSC